MLAIGQQSHAWISGQLARAWGNERFAEPEPWEDVCLAAEQHDIGFAEWDLEPALNPETGLPRSFMEMPVADHLALWSPAPRWLLAQSRYAALLVSMHGSRLYERRKLEQLEPREAVLVRAYLEEQRRFQRELVDSLHANALALNRNSQLVWTWDFLSLAICLDWAPRAARDVPAVDGPLEIEIRPGPRPRTAVLDPWPLRAASLVVHCEGRRLDGVRPDFQRAPWERLEFEFLAG